MRHYAPLCVITASYRFARAHAAARARAQYCIGCLSRVAEVPACVHALQVSVACHAVARARGSAALPAPASPRGAGADSAVVPGLAAQRGDGGGQLARGAWRCVQLPVRSSVSPDRALAERPQAVLDLLHVIVANSPPPLPPAIMDSLLPLLFHLLLTTDSHPVKQSGSELLRAFVRVAPDQLAAWYVRTCPRPAAAARAPTRRARRSQGGTSGLELVMRVTLQVLHPCEPDPAALFAGGLLQNVVLKVRAHTRTRTRTRGALAPTLTAAGSSVRATAGPQAGRGRRGSPAQRCAAAPAARCHAQPQGRALRRPARRARPA